MKATQLFEGIEHGTGRFVTIRDEHRSFAADRIAQRFNNNSDVEASPIEGGGRLLGQLYQGYIRNAAGKLEPIGVQFYVR
jgi:hypothetical protein